jgi:hypothetical protein
MTKQPGRDALGPAQSSSGTGVDRGTASADRGTAGVGAGPDAGAGAEVGVGVGGTVGDNGEGGKLRAVMRDFGPAWEIEQVPPGAAWVAVTRRGSWVHVIAAHDLDTLRAKIEAAQREETAPASAPSPTSPPPPVS